MAKLTPEEKKLQHEFFEIWQKLCPMSSEALSEVFDVLEEYNIHLGGGLINDKKRGPLRSSFHTDKQAQTFFSMVKKHAL